MSEEEYSDDFSREDLNQKGNKKTFLIDEAVEIERDKMMDQNINRIDNDSKKLKKPHTYSKDDDHYSFAATSEFHFKEPDHFTHWKTIDRIDLRNIIAGDIQQLNTVMNELAFSNFNDPSFVAPTREGRNALQIMQFSLQYMMFTQNEIANRIKTLHNYIDHGKEQLSQIRKIENAQKDRIKKQKKTDRKLNEQAIHYEFLIKKFRPDLQPDKLQELHKDIDILSQVAEGKSLAKIEQKSLKETKEKLAKGQEIEESKKPKRPATAEASVDVQQDFMRDIKDKLEKEFDRERRKMEDKISQKDLEIKKMDLEMSTIKMSELNLDEYQSQRVRALTKIMQEVIKNEDKQDEESIARLFGLDKIIRKERVDNEKDEAKRIQKEMEQKLDSERRKFMDKEKEIEKKAYDKAKHEFELELKKSEIEYKQKEIQNQQVKDEQIKSSNEKEKKDKRSKLIVDSNINPLNIKSTPKKTNLDTPHIKEVVEDDIEEDIYSEEFDEYDSNKFDKNERDDLEESKVTDRPPKGKTAGQRLINRFTSYNDSIDESATLDFNLTKTGSILDSLPFPKNAGQNQNKDK